MNRKYLVGGFVAVGILAAMPMVFAQKEPQRGPAPTPVQVTPAELEMHRSVVKELAEAASSPEVAEVARRGQTDPRFAEAASKNPKLIDQIAPPSRRRTPYEIRIEPTQDVSAESPACCSTTPAQRGWCVRVCTRRGCLTVCKWKI